MSKKEKYVKEGEGKLREVKVKKRREKMRKWERGEDQIEQLIVELEITLSAMQRAFIDNCVNRIKNVKSDSKKK